jgi:serine/threonine protein kinase/tetratricopeptide (TPR) repeat protein
MGVASTGLRAAERETVDCVGGRLTRTRSLGNRSAPGDDPRTIDRYTVQRRLGVGGMSVVYEALDERIGRRVALKLMLVSDGGSDRERLRREAQALARVSHPNVVEVFEIGEHEGKAYVAMALVEGEPLDRWLRSKTRSPVEIVEAFAQAGEGLAAAHGQGLVHRDFKPGNVLMGNDGRVRVVDFGLVRESGAVESSSASALPSPAEISGGTPPSVWTESLTRTGAMVGTPAYMSPEQLGGLAAGPASDQFSFCVALYEAIYRQHPFVVDGHWQQLPYNVLEGRIVRPPKERRVPAALGKVLMRGLLLRPEARWPSMLALLHALRRALDRRGPRLPSALVGAGLLLLGAGMMHRTSPSEVSACEEGAATMRKLWSPDVRDDLREAWVGTGQPGAADTWARVDERLQADVADWWGIHEAACAGSSQAPSSATCLLRWAEGLRTHLRVMERPNESLLYNAVQLVGELPPLTACTAALDAPPGEPVLDAPPWKEELDHVDVLLRSGQPEEAAPLVEDLLARAASEGSARLTAEANLRVGWIFMQRGEVEPAAEALQEAYFGAKPLGDDRLAAESALALLQVFGELRHRPAEAARWGGHARAETERLGDTLLTSRYLNAWGRSLRAEHKLDEALEQHQRALELQRSLPTATANDLGLSHFQVGSVLGLLGRGDEARPHLEEALRIHEEQLGSQHPRVVATLTNIGIFMSYEGRDAEGLAKLQLAHETGLSNPSNPWPAAFPLHAIGQIHLREGRPRAAAEALRSYLDAYLATHEADDVNSASVELLSCEIAMQEEQYEIALDHCRRALEVEGLGTLDASAVGVYQVMATIYARQGKPEESLASQRMAYREGRDKADEETEPKVRRWIEMSAEQGLGRALMLAGHYDDALTALERARASIVEIRGPHDWRQQGVELDIGTVLLLLGRYQEALTGLQAVIVPMEERTGPDALQLQSALVALARAELGTGHVALALEHGERALALLEARSEPVVEVEARACFVLARALVASHGDPARAIALARRAEEGFAGEGLLAQRELAEVRAWLAEHGGRSVARGPRRAAG